MAKTEASEVSKTKNNSIRNVQKSRKKKKIKN